MLLYLAMEAIIYNDIIMPIMSFRTELPVSERALSFELIDLSYIIERVKYNLKEGKEILTYVISIKQLRLKRNDKSNLQLKQNMFTFVKFLDKILIVY